MKVLSVPNSHDDKDGCYLIEALCEATNFLTVHVEGRKTNKPRPRVPLKIQCEDDQSAKFHTLYGVYSSVYLSYSQN